MALARPPSVDALVQSLDDGTLPRPIVVDIVRAVIEAYRSDSDTDIEAEARRRIASTRREGPLRVINATGVILHTNLGRAPWSTEAVEAAATISAGYGNVELDLGTGGRGRRNSALEDRLVHLTGAEAALVVNNNAAALFLVLMAMGAGLPVPVSRGELIEIGGSYRLPELMAASGAVLVEVGTTNRTRLGDYAAVKDSALLLKVHPSNYRIVGFSGDTPLEDLASLAAERRIPLIFDAGSGLLDDRVPWLAGAPPMWLQGEPGVRQALEAGADLVVFSGDKLLGGPQAGIVVGDAEMIATLRSHPATRALRVDGATDAALGATLGAYLSGHADRLPLWRMAALSAEEVGSRADGVVAALGGGRLSAGVIDGASTLGGGSAPGAEIPTRLIHIDSDVYDRLLAADPPILARRVAGAVVLDLRTVDPRDDASVVAALQTQ